MGARSFETLITALSSCIICKSQSNSTEWIWIAGTNLWLLRRWLAPRGSTRRPGEHEGAFPALIMAPVPVYQPTHTSTFAFAVAESFGRVFSPSAPRQGKVKSSLSLSLHFPIPVSLGCAFFLGHTYSLKSSDLLWKKRKKLFQAEKKPWAEIIPQMPKVTAGSTSPEHQLSPPSSQWCYSLLGHLLQVVLRNLEPMVLENCALIRDTFPWYKRSGKEERWEENQQDSRKKTLPGCFCWLRESPLREV